MILTLSHWNSWSFTIPQPSQYPCEFTGDRSRGPVVRNLAEFDLTLIGKRQSTVSSESNALVFVEPLDPTHRPSFPLTQTLTRFEPRHLPIIWTAGVLKKGRILHMVRYAKEAVYILCERQINIPWWVQSVILFCLKQFEWVFTRRSAYKGRVLNYS